ncbi:MAG: ATP-binding cassette domain-containing protein [Bacteroidales bacterium]|jgi:ABC-2 type transport system ATP-binding protein|nr:ATP-binding cassette domain-containing protein [Bacteroidales bacterium]MBR6900327.1 ATP-binding cassette domain-containing protein [Bacteroidales bacterium]
MLLQADNLSKSYGAHRVLDGISFTADCGEVVGILGANGAGKTTLLRIVNLILEADSGTLLFDGHPMTRADLAAVGYLPEERGLYRRMRVGEQVVYLARLKGMSRADARSEARAWFERLGAADWWNRPANRLSKGMQQKVQFISTVVHRPRLLILDEPFSGFDADNAAMLRAEIERLSRSGTAILLSTHNREAAASLCHKTLQL